MRKHQIFGLVLLCGASAWAAGPSEADRVYQAVKNMPATSSATITRHIYAAPLASAPTVQPLQNLLSVLGDNYENNAVPCTYCVPSALGPSLGLPLPDTTIHADATTSYVMINVYQDQTYSGSCSWTFLVKDQAGKYIVKIGPATFPVSPGGIGFVGTGDTIPAYATVAGNGLFETLITCGTTNTVSQIPVFITYP